MVKDKDSSKQTDKTLHKIGIIRNRCLSLRVNSKENNKINSQKQQNNSKKLKKEVLKNELI